MVKKPLKSFEFRTVLLARISRTVLQLGEKAVMTVETEGYLLFFLNALMIVLFVSH